MANEIRVSYTTGATLFAIVTTSTGQFVNGTTPEALNPRTSAVTPLR